MKRLREKLFLSKNSVVTLWRTVQVKLFSIKIYITICLGKHRIAKGTMVKRIFSGQLGPVTSLECTLYCTQCTVYSTVHKKTATMKNQNNCGFFRIFEVKQTTIQKYKTKKRTLVMQLRAKRKLL